MKHADFKRFLDDLTPQGRDEWWDRQVATIRRFLSIFKHRPFREDEDDVMTITLTRMLMRPTGEYAPKPIDQRPQRYFERCTKVTIKDLTAKAMAKKRTYQRSDHAELSEAVVPTISADDASIHFDGAMLQLTPEQFLSRKAAASLAVRSLNKARFRGITRAYADSLISFAENGSTDGEIAEVLGSSPEAIRKSRERCRDHLAREGLIATDPSSDAQGKIHRAFNSRRKD
jgi:hypothetical protein